MDHTVRQGPIEHFSKLDLMSSSPYRDIVGRDDHRRTASVIG